jgi:hypothetical protein
VYICVLHYYVPVSKITNSVAVPNGKSMTCVHSQDVILDRHLSGTFSALHTITSSGCCNSSGAEGNTIDILLKFGNDQLPSANVRKLFIYSYIDRLILYFHLYTYHQVDIESKKIPNILYFSI